MVLGMKQYLRPTLFFLLVLIVPTTAQPKANSKKHSAKKVPAKVKPVPKAAPPVATKDQTVTLPVWREMPPEFTGYPAPFTDLWPQLNERIDRGGPGNIEFFNPAVPRLPEGDPVSVSSVAGVRGRLFYLSHPYIGSDNDEWWATFRGVGGVTGAYYPPTDEVNKSVAPYGVSAVSFPFDWNMRYYAPKFSPNGQYVTFEEPAPVPGDPRIDTYFINLWDLKNRQIGGITVVAWDNFRWSPDCQKIGCIQGGNSYGVADAKLQAAGLVYPPQLFVISIPYAFDFYPIEKRADGKFYQNQDDLGQRLISPHRYSISFAWLNSHTVLFTEPHSNKTAVVKPKISSPALPAKSVVQKVADPSSVVSPWQRRTPIHLIPTTFSDIRITEVNPPTITREMQGAETLLPSRLLIPYGYDPVPSPDQRWIAFTGWSEKAVREFENPVAKSDQESREVIPDSISDLFLFDTVTGRRFLLKTLHRAEDSLLVPKLLWSHDGKTLVVAWPVLDGPQSKQEMQVWTLQRSDLEGWLKAHPDLMLPIIDKSSAGNAPEPSIEELWKKSGSIVQGDFSTALQRDSDFEPILPNGIHSITPHSVSRDSKYLYFTVQENILNIQNDREKNTSLFAFDLTSGNRQLVAKISGKEASQDGFDWYEE